MVLPSDTPVDPQQSPGPRTPAPGDTVRFINKGRWCFGTLIALTPKTARVLYLGRERRLNPVNVHPWPPDKPNQETTK